MTDFNLRYEGVLPAGTSGLPNWMRISQSYDDSIDSTLFTIGMSQRRVVHVTDELYMTSYPDTEPVEDAIRRGAVELLLETKELIDAALADLVD